MFSNKLNNIIGIIDNLNEESKNDYTNDIDDDYDYNSNKDNKDFELSI